MEEILFTDVQTTFFEVQLEKGNLDRPEGRQKDTDDLTKETKDHVPVERIHTWFRNQMNKKKGGGKGGRVVLKVIDRSQLSHGEIVTTFGTMKKKKKMS